MLPDYVSAWPEGPLPQYQSPMICLNSTQCRNHGAARFYQAFYTGFADTHGPKAIASPRELTEVAASETSGNPKLAPIAGGMVVGGAGGSTGKPNSGSNARLDMRKVSESGVSSHAVATNRGQRKRIWSAGKLRSRKFQHQQKNKYHFSSKKFAGQVFDEKPNWDLIPKRALFSFLAQNECNGEVLGIRPDSKGLVGDGPEWGIADLKAICSKSASTPGKKNTERYSACSPEQKLTQLAEIAPLEGHASTSFLQLVH